MNRRALWATLVGFVALVATALGINVSTGNSPVLGLDLRGGLSVIYATAEPADVEQLTIVRDLMREQLESFGIAEPDVRVEGENIVVDLPGVTDQEAAFDALKVSGIVTLRPVLQCQAGVVNAGSDSLGGIPGIEGDSPADGDSPAEGDLEESLGGSFGSSRPAPAATETTEPDTAPSTTTPSTTVPDAEPTDAETTDAVTIDAETTDGETVAPETTDGDEPTSEPIGSLPFDTVEPATPETPGLPDGTDLLPYPSAGQSCLLGPAGGTGEVFEQGSADAVIDQRTGGWVVAVDLRSEGEILWNGLAAQCYNRQGICPSGQLAIVLDDVIQSAPTVQTPNFQGSVQISGNFTEAEVNDLARVLNRGAFPVPVEQQRVETVSATAGQDSLNAALIAGLIGIAVMLTFMVLYYRRLSVVIISGLAVWGMAVYSIATMVSQATNFALTLAGATGIIVAVGVTIDTYVVFFERLRDEQRNGRLVRNAAPRAFQATWRTIVSADLVSLMAALILFWLSVGSVKGFALYLGLTTICDLIVCYFFVRPATFLLAGTRWFDGVTRSTTEAIGAAS